MVEKIKSKNRDEDKDLSGPSTSAVASSRAAEEEEKHGKNAASSNAKGNNMSMADDELVINTSESIEIVTSFDQLGIPEQLLRGKFC